MAELMLSLGASMDSLDQRGLTPLQLARHRKAHQIVSILEAHMSYTSDDDDQHEYGKHGMYDDHTNGGQIDSNGEAGGDDTHIPLVEP